MPRRGGTGRTSRRVVALTAKARHRGGSTVRPHASIVEVYEASNLATDMGSPTVDQYAAG
ncbi:hypothetical protein GCM10027074_34270 [Streptomyces deserti]